MRHDETWKLETESLQDTQVSKLSQDRDITRRPASADRTARRQFQFPCLCISRVHLFYDI